MHWLLRTVHAVAIKEIAEFELQKEAWCHFLCLKNLLPSSDGTSRRLKRQASRDTNDREWHPLSNGVRVDTYFPSGIAHFLAQVATRPKTLTELMVHLWEHALWECECFCSAEGPATAKRAKKEPKPSTYPPNKPESQLSKQR